MIYVDTDDPDQPYTYAPRLSEPLTVRRCGIAIYESGNAQYYYDPATDPLAGIGLLPPSAEPPPCIGRTCWIEYPKGTDTWYKTTVRKQTTASLLVDGVSGIPQSTLEPVAVKVVKYWTDVNDE